MWRLRPGPERLRAPIPPAKRQWAVPMKYDMRGSLWRIDLATGTAAVIGIVRTRTAGRDRVSWRRLAALARRDG
jgi:hypothetical protein